MQSAFSFKRVSFIFAALVMLAAFTTGCASTEDDGGSVEVDFDAGAEY